METPVWSTGGMSPTKSNLPTLNYENTPDNKSRSMSQSEASRRTHLRSTCGSTSRVRNKIKRHDRITHGVTSAHSSDKRQLKGFNDSPSFNTSFSCNGADRTIESDSVTSVCGIKLRRMFKCYRNSPLNHLWKSLVFILFSLICISATDQCALGLKTPGRTWPAGDIVLEVGRPLRILCMLNKTYIDAEFPGKNASDLIFFRSNREMEPEFIKIINETTIEMFVEKPPPSKDMYYCKLRLNDGYSKKYEAVCLNNVVIGSKPKEPQNFTCVSNNWENMTCTWDPVPNYVETRFSLAFKLLGRAGGRKLYPCPKEKEDQKPLAKNRCYWDTSTNPIYRQPYEYYIFNLTAENVLGNISVLYKFHHYAHVIPAKPSNLTVVNKTSDSVLLHWSVPFPMQNFPPGLHHRVTYQHQWDSRKTWQVINITNDIHMYKKHFNLTDLQFANTLYDVRVFMKSAVAIGEDKWGQFSDVTFRTPPRLPGLPPRTDIGSFEITENSANRDVYLYWKSIPPYLENGDNFRYQVAHVEENGRTSLIEPNETTRTYAKFKGISFNSYRFELVTANVVGANPEKAVIFVPSRFGIPREPLAFTKIAFEDGLYELSWKPPIMNAEITNYTIFWCDNERDRPYQCTGFLDWVHVSSSTTIYNMTVPDPQKVYQFAISANTKHASSGMVWASCTVIHNKVVGKMKSVWINRIGSDFIEVGWKLECSDRIGIVEGFNIYYCPIITPYNLNCKGPKLNTTIRADPHTIHGTVTGLKPYTTYMISVAVLTKSGEGLHSDALYNTTMEAAPTPPRNVVISNVTNSTMLVSWEPPAAMNGVLRYYEVHYSGNVEQVEESTHVQLKDLLAFKNYSIYVTACTVSCSSGSSVIRTQTGIGLPGKINRVPIVRFINSSQVSVVWSKPANPGGNLEYYQVASKYGDIQNSTRIQSSIPIPDCKTEGRNTLHEFTVRAVNIAPNGVHLYGPWSEAGSGNCYSDGPSSMILVIIWVIGVVGSIAFMFCLFYTSKRVWLKYKVMQDVEVQLPPGLAGEKLLQKVAEQHIRQSSADSSGCSSGQESVTSSLTSDSHVSTDSGTEIDPVVSSNKLLESTTTWESSSLRQRNVGTMRPSGQPDSARWDSYVKVSKPGETVVDDNLSLARSTPNLTDSSGFMMPQHTWSSTGYISMPSSEELSNNPSPVPKDSNVGGYSVVGLLPKSRDKIDSYSQLSSNLAEAKPAAPYVSLASLEAKPREKKILNNVKNLTKFIDPPNVETPYVQTGLIDKSISSTSRKAEVMKPYVAVGALPDADKKGKLVKDERKQPQVPGTIDASTKPYVLASPVFNVLHKSDEGDETVVEESHEDSLSSEYGMFWEPGESRTDRRDEPEVKSSGYVAVRDLQKSEHQGMAKVAGGFGQKVEKPSATGADEQYSKVTVAPHNMQ
ncbi:cytokine receptor [Diachasma alloeum]|uniref:cytokine receptor n=1 Tax=Diachasma alloeum TaxID=454923 RepID=UPI0007383B76|nr:cytokine receptor [Diachasma alloeum]XP_015122630.1 cytokine receptor [Diachasma alloeum]